MNAKASDKWHNSGMPIIEQYTPKDIFNLDKTAVMQPAIEENTGSKKQEVPWRKDI
jgi:hypothetical protein